MNDGIQEQATTTGAEGKRDVAVATAEKPQRNVVVSTPGYRLETTANVALSPQEQKRYEAAFYAGTLLQSRLKAEDIQSFQPEASRQRPIEGVFTEDVLPIINLMLQTPLESSSVEELQALTDTLTGMVDARVLSQAEPQVLVIDTPQRKTEIDELLGVWVHDIKGNATAPKTSYQLFQRLLQKEGIKLSDPQVVISPDVMAKITRYREMIGTRLKNMLDVLQSGLPFGEPEVEAFPHEAVDAHALLGNIVGSVEESGYLRLHMQTERILSEIPEGMQVDWNSDLAKRCIWNVVSNATKAYEQVPPTPFEGRYLDVDMHVVDGMLEITFDDWGKGYPEEMRERWHDPSQRAAAPTGWAREDIATTGLGLREYTEILEKHYGGSLDIYKNRFGGARTVMRIPLIKSK